jgi:hypothetical protein
MNAEIQAKNLAIELGDAIDAMYATDSVLAFLEGVCANQRENETPLNTAGLYWIITHAREELEPWLGKRG